jgi:DNA repair protein RadC
MNKNTIAEINVSYTNVTKPEERIQVTSSKEAERVFRSIWNTDTIDLQEEFKVLLLNRANQVLGVYNASKGGTTGTVVDIRLILAVALKANACSIILGHNHPSGNLRASEADKALTKKIVEAGSLVEVKVLDHLIITQCGCISFANKGIIN